MKRGGTGILDGPPQEGNTDSQQSDAAFAHHQLMRQPDNIVRRKTLMSSQIQAGDVVVLNSGGPDMTVKWVSGTECYCEWFDGKKVVGSSFEIAQLRKTDTKG